MLKITLIAVGKLREKYLKDASAEYQKRLSSYCVLNIIEVDPVKLSDKPSAGEISSALEREADIILKKMPNSAKIIALCIEGKHYSSEDISSLLNDTAINGFSNIVLIVGGSHGLSGRLKVAADKKMSMSRMTFPHQLARIMLLEQVYRGFKINEGSTYHK